MNKSNSISIRRKLVILFASIIFPLLLLLIYITTYTFNLFKEQIIADKTAIMQLWENQIATSLNEAEKYINYLALNDLDFEIMMQDNQDDFHVLSKRKVYREFEKKIQDFIFVDAIFIFDSSEDPSIVVNSPSSFNQMYKDEAFITIAQNIQGGWHTFTFNENTVFVHMYEFLNIKMGFAASGGGMRSQIVSDNDHFTGDLHISNMVTEHLKTDRWQLTYDSQEYPFRLSLQIDEKETLRFLPQIHRIIAIICVIILLAIPLFLYLLRDILLIPLAGINNAILKLEKGDIDYRIPPGKASREFQRIYHAFNSMTEQIKYLKIRNYEEQLAKQRAQLQILQLQVNPHFLINCLNIVFSLAQLKDFETIQNLVCHMSNFFRARLRKGSSEFVTMREELDQVKDYLDIVEICMALPFHADIYMDECLANALIPPLSIQTLVENIIKHATANNKHTNILARAVFVDDRISVVVQDDGVGISPDRLKDIQSDKKLIDEQEEHFGLQNTRERIMRMPHGSFSIKSRLGEGTTVTLAFSYQRYKEDVRDDQ